MSTADEQDLSPSERYADYRNGRKHPVLRGFRGLYDFPLDDFQVRACAEIEEGRGVLVAAPTGSGKTIVGEFAVHLALETGRKCFYTTPIKALSNQKYNDLVARYGADKVGLLTGDNVVNGEAPIVVMTTEVLRNMLYAGSRTLLGLGFVVMDEVHYLADRARGAVWEEVIIHLPESVSVVSLSATVSNAEEFGEWLETVRGDTTTIVEEKRPVPLYQHVMVGKRLLDLFASSDVDAAAGFVKEGAPVNDELIKVARDDWASNRISDRRSPRGRSKPGQGGARQVGNGRRVWIPSRVDVIDRLDREGLLPAIVVHLQPGRLRRRRHPVPEREHPAHHARGARRDLRSSSRRPCRHLPEDDLQVLGYHDFLDGLTRGVAAHHAGMLPKFKECVEALFLRGLCKVVFATETLALGINMPARTVVIEKLDKWNGETHAAITPGEYTQLTGRAGRRGLDVEGHGVVLWQPGHQPARGRRPRLDPHLPAALVVPPVVQHGGQPGAPVRPGEVPRAAGAVVRAVPGRQGRRRAGPAAAQERGRAGRLPRGRDLPPRRLHGVRRPAPPDQRGREGRQPGPPRRPARGGDGVAAPPQAGRRDRGADRQVRRVRRRHRPGLVARGPAAVRRHRRPAGPPARDDRLPGRRWPRWARLKIPKNFNGRNPQMRRDLASALRTRTHDLAPPPPSKTASGSPTAATRRAPTPTTQIARLRAELQGAPVPRLPGPRGPRPVGGAVLQARPRRADPASAGSSSAPTPSPGSSTGSARC